MSPYIPYYESIIFNILKQQSGECMLKIQDDSGLVLGNFQDIFFKTVEETVEFIFGDYNAVLFYARASAVTSGPTLSPAITAILRFFDISDASSMLVRNVLHPSTMHKLSKLTECLSAQLQTTEASKRDD